MKTTILKTTWMSLILALFSIGQSTAAVITVRGRVSDATDGSPLIGCSVLTDGSQLGAVTDLNGKYTIQVEEGSILVFSYIGYENKKVKARKGTLNVALTPLLTTLEEISVVTQSECLDQGVSVADVQSVRTKEKSYEVSTKMRFIPPTVVRDMEVANEEYSASPENRFKWVKDNPLSTFSIDVDVASYGNMRRYINQGQLPPANAIRTEELINYFSYDYSRPTGKDPVKITTEAGECPWNRAHRLVRIGLKAREIAGDDLPASNLVFLIDVSGSMYGPTRLELVKSSLKLLVNNLREEDRVAIVVYAGSAGTVLPSTSGADKQKIREALDRLTAGGSTAGGAGIKLAYKIARENLIRGGNNRIILCTDGDFNVGVSSPQGLEELIVKERQSGVFLTLLGYGMGNYKDNRMQVLAEKGNGNHAYIDNIQEANKVLVKEFGGTLFTVAKDVKLQIEFNPSKVQAYRLIGYESRLLNDEDFNDDTKDAGEMGAGHRVTALYEVVPAGITFAGGGSVDPLKYQIPEKPLQPAYSNSAEMLTVKLRYKEPDGDNSRKIEVSLTDSKWKKNSSDFNFAASVALFGQLLNRSQFVGKAGYDQVIELAKAGMDRDEQGYRREFIRLVEATKGL